MSSSLENQLNSLVVEVDTMRSVLRISQEVALAATDQALLEIVGRPAFDHGALSAALLYIDVDPAGKPEWLEAKATRRLDDKTTITPGSRFPLAQYPTAGLWINEPYKAVILNDLLTGVDENTRRLFSGLGVRAVVFIPLYANNRWVGLLTFNWDQPRMFTRVETEAYQALPALLSPVIASRRMAAEQGQIISRQEQEIREKSLLLDAIETNPTLIFTVKDLRGVYLFATPGYLATTGKSAEEVIGKTDLEIFTDGRYSKFPAIDQQVIDTRQMMLMEDASMSVVDGKIHYFLVQKYLVYNIDRNPYALATLVIDITAQKEAEEQLRVAQTRIIAAQRELLQELSTPIIPLVERIIVVPLVASIDETRARDITRNLLAGISRYRAKIVILDITGVQVVDSGVADYLNRTIQAARLKGAQTIITGVSDAVAETIVELEIDWGGQATLRDLQAGLRLALEMRGIRLEIPGM